MGSGPSVPRDKHVVIVGGGFGGTKIALLLHKQNVSYTVIDVKDAMYFNIASVRAVVKTDFAKALFIPYDKTFGNHFKRGKVTGVNPSQKKVVLESGEEVSYDVLVLATGSTTFSPFKTSTDDTDAEALVQLCNDTVEKVKKSKEIVIIGGGPVGCEVAGEIRTEYKDVNVTIIQSGDFMVSDYGAKFQKSLKEKLNKLGVKILLGERVAEGLQDAGVYGPCDVRTDKGTSINADLVFRCTGSKVNSQAYATSLSEVTNSDGSIQVNEYLQVSGHTDVFAIGDCTDLKEPKLAYRVGEQLPVLHHNIAAVLNKGSMKTYNPNTPSIGMGISLGRNDGILVKANGGLLPSFLTVMLKSKKLLVPQSWSDMKQKQP